ncbi:hypothetical protein ACOSQ3_020064 [Xanthoceras sorbifolium]
MEETNNGEIIESKKRAHMPMRLVCAVKYYDWGVVSDNSQVARLCSFNSKSNIDPDDTYAEFWTGTHESEPSFLDPGVVSLKIWILDFLDVLGDQVIFLSCSRCSLLEKALSIFNHSRACTRMKITSLKWHCH